jgi:hypothetical protein
MNTRTNFIKALASIVSSLFVTCASPAAWAACANGEPVLDEIRLTHAGQNYRGELCLMEGVVQGVQDRGNGVMQLNLFSVMPDGEALTATTLKAISVEGGLREIRFDRAAYVLHREYPTLAVRIEDRFHGVGLEQYLTNLHLYMPQGKQLKHVAEFMVERDSWGKGCEPECQDSVHSRSVVVVLSRETKGYRDIQLKTRARETPQGTGKPRLQKETEIWRWNGQEYEIVQ